MELFQCFFSSLCFLSGQLPNRLHCLKLISMIATEKQFHVPLVGWADGSNGAFSSIRVDVLGVLMVVLNCLTVCDQGTNLSIQSLNDYVALLTLYLFCAILAILMMKWPRSERSPKVVRWRWALVSPCICAIVIFKSCGIGDLFDAHKTVFGRL